MTQYYIKARANSSLLVVDTDIEKDFESLSLVKRFNAVGTWSLQLRKESAHYGTFAPVLTSGKYGFPNGILVYVDNEDGNGPQLVMSGPQLDIDVKSQQDSTQPVLITGACDNYYLSKRRALPCPHYPLIAFYSRGINLGGPAGGGMASGDTVYGIDSGQVGMSIERYYPCLDASGTTCTDYGPAASNATYVGGCTLGQNSLVDDPNTCVLLNGTTGYVSINTGLGLNSGNNPWTMFGWFMATALPGVGAAMNALGYGKSPATAKQTVSLYIDHAGLPHNFCQGASDVVGTTAITLNIPHFFVLMYDGTNLTAWMDGQQFATQNPSPLSIVISNINFGADATNASPWIGYTGHDGFLNGNLTSAMIQQMYAVGVSRHAYESYDDNGGFWAYPGSPNKPTPGPAFTHASTGLIYFVQRNCNASALPVAANGACAPATTFTTLIGTHSARQIPNLSIAADPAVGSAVFGPACKDILLDFLAALALQSSPELGFKLEQSGSNLVFTVFIPTDLTSTTIFSRDLYGAQGNILDYEWKVSAPSANYLIAGGANPTGATTTSNLQDRLFGENEDAASIAANGYLEDFLDYRQATTGPTLQQAITGQLNKDASIFQVQATMLDQPGILYFKGPAGKGYDLGNKVTVIVDGFTFQQVIREIAIDLQPGQPAIIQPAIGTPLNTAVANEYTTIAQRLRDVGISIAGLNTNY